MTEQSLQGPEAGEAVEANTGLSEHFRLIGELVRAAATGDRSAQLALEIFNNQQLAEIKNLKLKLRAARIQEITQTALSFTSSPEPAKPK